MSLTADTGFREAVTEGHAALRQLFAVDASSGTIIARVPMHPSTNINVGTGLVRRAGTIVVPNRDGLYTPGAGIVEFGIAWLIRYIVRTTTGDLTCDQPLLFPDSDTIDLGGRTVEIPVSDGMRIVGDGATLAVPIVFDDGTELDNVVRRLLIACGAPDDDAYFDLDSGGQHVNGVSGYEVGVRVADVLNQLMVDYHFDLWAAAPLVYTMRPIPDPMTVSPVATWQLGRQVRLLGLRITRQSRAKNHAIVEGVDRLGRPFTTEVFDLNPESPVMFGTPGIGDLPVSWKSDGINDPDQAREVGRSLLVNRSVSRTFDALVPHDPSLDRRDVVRIVEPTTDTDTLAMLDQFPVPSAPGSQQITVLDARSLS